LKRYIANISEGVVVIAPSERVFAAMTDWDRQGEWMIGTVVSGDKYPKIGSTLKAFSGFGRVGFLDTMSITDWNPPFRCDVLHTGKLVRGTGSFIVEPVSEETSRFIWSESLELPFGYAGRIGWSFVRPIFKFVLILSIKRFSKWASNYIPTP
jgi:hypothetical protein